MKWFRAKIVFLAFLSATAFGADNVIINPVPDQDTVIKVNDGGVVKDLFRADADIAKVIIDGDFQVTGVSTGVTAASAAPDWLTLTDYGLYEIIVDPNSGITYRANNAHTSAGTNLTDNVGDYDVIGSASNGFLGTGWVDYTPVTQGFGTIGGASFKWRRLGDSIEMRGRFNTGTVTAVEARIGLPPGLTVAAFAESIVGHGARDDATNTSPQIAFIGNPGEAYIKVSYIDNFSSRTAFAAANGNVIAGSSQGFWFRATVPIAEYVNSGVTVSIQDLTEETVWVDETVIPIVGAISSTVSSVGDAKFQITKDSNGQYFIEFHIVDLQFTGFRQDHIVDFGGGLGAWPISPQVGQGRRDNNENMRVETNAGAVGRIIINSQTTTFDLVSLSGKFSLGGKPTVFDANRENPAAVSAFVPEASTTAAGIVAASTQTLGGLKTIKAFGDANTDNLLQMVNATGDVVFNINSLGNMAIGDVTAGDITAQNQTFRIKGLNNVNQGSVLSIASSFTTPTADDWQSYIAFSGGGAGSIGECNGTGSSQRSTFMTFQKNPGQQYQMWMDPSAIMRVGLNALGSVCGEAAGTVIGDQTSDARLKENVIPITRGLDTVNQLNPVEFNYTYETASDHRLGFIAQEVELLVPESPYETHTEKDGVENFYAMDYDQIIPVLTKAIQELSAKNDSLKARIEALEAN